MLANMKKKIAFVLSAVLSLTGFWAFVVYEDPLTTLLKKVEEFYSTYPQEKVYLHLDKPYYAIGDNIWFKAYLIDAKTSKPTEHSAILYIDLINRNNEVKEHLKLPMSGGITWGNISLSDSLEEGNYRIRAYTNWMRNAGPTFFYDKTLKIGNYWANTVFIKSHNVLLSGQNLSNTINFSDKNGLPHNKCAVSYQLIQNGKVLRKGKGETSANGDLKIVIENLNEPLKENAAILATITLPNKQSFTKTILLQAAKPGYDVQFFPEGGSLIENFPCKIGFKAINNYGRGEDISGSVIDENGAEITNFQSKYLGMGNFVINFVPEKTYNAKVKFKDGSTQIFKLPKVAKSGQIIAVNNLLPDKVTIKVFSSLDLIDKGEVYLVGQHNGLAYFSSKIIPNKQLTTLNINKAELPSGITQITLLNAQMLPLAERIIFVNNPLDKINLDVAGLNDIYDAKTNVKATLTAKVNDKPIQGSFSIAVTNNDAVKADPENESNIFTTLLLTSDLTGYVENPNHYFLKNDEETAAQLDNLLLTQGWRKVSWKIINNNIPPVYAFKAEKGISISGKVAKNGKPVVKGKVMLVSNSSGFFMLDTLTDAEGRFSFDNLQFTDGIKFIVQARTDENKKFVDIEMDKYANQNVTSNKNIGDIEINVNQAMISYLKQSENYFNDLVAKGWLNRTVMLKEVNIVEKKNPTPNSLNLNGPARADQVFTAKDLETAFSLSQYLQGRIVGTIIRNGQAYSMRNSRSRPMAIFLDGMNMGGGFSLDDIIVQDVESIEILRNIAYTSVYGDMGAAGVILITTKRGSFRGFSRSSLDIIVITPKGFSTVKEFYSPKYASPQDDTPDYRSSIFWEPQLATNADGKAELNFYNGQFGTYRMVIEGIDASGNIARKVLTYKIK